MMLLSTRKGGVARAALRAIAPTVKTTRAPASICVHFLMLMVEPPTVCVTMKTTSLGAQTERRDDAGPVRSLLRGKASPAVSLPRGTGFGFRSVAGAQGFAGSPS